MVSGEMVEWAAEPAHTCATHATHILTISPIGEQVLHRIVRFVVVVPAVVVLAALGVANIHDVRLALDPFRPDDPALSVVLPFYVWLLAALIVGVVFGGLATWMTQARWRRSARRQDAEARHWRAEADRLHRERERELETGRQVVPAGR